MYSGVPRSSQSLTPVFLVVSLHPRVPPVSLRLPLATVWITLLALDLREPAGAIQAHHCWPKGLGTLQMWALQRQSQLCQMPGGRAPGVERLPIPGGHGRGDRAAGKGAETGGCCGAHSGRRREAGGRLYLQVPVRMGRPSPSWPTFLAGCLTHG